MHEMDVISDDKTKQGKEKETKKPKDGKISILSEVKVMNDDGMEFIRKTYNVPAKIGGRVEYKSMPGTIVGTTGAYLRIKLDCEKDVKTYHPTWEMEYYDA